MHINHVRTVARDILAVARALRAAAVLDYVTLSAEYTSAADYIVITRHPEAPVTVGNLHNIARPVIRGARILCTVR